MLPLSLLPFLASLVVWPGSTMAGYLAVVRRIAPHSLTLWLALAFPSSFQNLIHGQNGFLSAALLGAGLFLVERNTWLAGVFLGFLTFKPHLVLLVPVALVAGRCWKTLPAMCLTFGVLALGST